MEVRINCITLPVQDNITPETKCMAAEEYIIYAARVSAKERVNNETAPKLLSFLIKHKHWSPFEMISIGVEIKTSRAIAQQILRHRSFCLGADTKLIFDLPNKLKNRTSKYKPHYMTISEVYRKFYGGAAPIPNRWTGDPQVIPMQDRIMKMGLRCLNEDTGEIIHTHINDVTKNDLVMLYRITSESGREIDASLKHKFFTENGWRTLGEVMDQNLKVVMQGQKRTQVLQEAPVIDYTDENWLQVEGWEDYLVSDKGRYKRKGGLPKTGSIGSHGYCRCSFNKPGVQGEELMHRLVLKTFLGEPKKGDEGRHLSHNKLDNQLTNLSWGTSLENSNDSVKNDCHGRLVSVLEKVVSVVELGEQTTYDISVNGPWHNFVAEGYIVHNSFQEFSQRYAEVVDIETVQLRYQAESNRQSSTNKVESAAAAAIVKTAVEGSVAAYKELLQLGVAKECARMVLPLTTQTTIIMHGTLRSWIHFFEQRCSKHAQQEIQDIAYEARKQISKVCPWTAKALGWEDK